jgi:hypothetical protein
MSVDTSAENKEGQRPPELDGASAAPANEAVTTAPNAPPYMHSYFSTEYNECGQAAIAAIVDRLGGKIGNLPRTIKDPKDGLSHWNAPGVLAAIKHDGFVPDVVGGTCGTSGGQIQNALIHYGYRKSFCSFAGTTTHWEDLWKGLQQWVGAGWPAAVLLEAGKIPHYKGFLNLSGHWPVVFRISGGTVYLANCGSDALPMKQDAFLDAWNYLAFNPLAYGYNHCMVVPAN